MDRSPSFFHHQRPSTEASRRTLVKVSQYTLAYRQGSFNEGCYARTTCPPCHVVIRRLSIALRRVTRRNSYKHWYLPRFLFSYLGIATNCTKLRDWVGVEKVVRTFARKGFHTLDRCTSRGEASFPTTPVYRLPIFTAPSFHSAYVPIMFPKTRDLSRLYTQTWNKVNKK